MKLTQDLFSMIIVFYQLIWCFYYHINLLHTFVEEELGHIDSHHHGIIEYCIYIQ